MRLMPDRWGTPIGPFEPDEFEAACLPPGQAGEIVVSGPHVIAGYVRREGDEETKFRGGVRDGTAPAMPVAWTRRGGCGCWGDGARCWTTGGSLYPFTVEAAADRHWAVRRSACCGVGGCCALVVEPAAVGATAGDWAH